MHAYIHTNTCWFQKIVPLAMMMLLFVGDECLAIWEKWKLKLFCGIFWIDRSDMWESMRTQLYVWIFGREIKEKRNNGRKEVHTKVEWVTLRHQAYNLLLHIFAWFFFFHFVCYFSVSSAISSWSNTTTCGSLTMSLKRKDFFVPISNSAICLRALGLVLSIDWIYYWVTNGTFSLHPFMNIIIVK